MLNSAAPEVDLSSMTKAQLLEYAGANGITGIGSRNTKAQIISAIEEEMT